MRGWSRKILSSSQKKLKSLRSSHQNNVQSSLGMPCARSFIKSCIWVFAQAWTSECADDHQPFRKVLQKVVRSAQNAFNISHCKQWRQGRQQEQQVGRKCLIQHIHNWSITPFAIFCQRSGRVRRLPAIQLRPATVSCPPCAWESFKHSRCLSSMLQAEVSEVLLSFSKSLTSPLSAIGRYLVAHSQKRKHTAESSWVYSIEIYVNLLKSMQGHSISAKLQNTSKQYWGARSKKMQKQVASINSLVACLRQKLERNCNFQKWWCAHCLAFSVFAASESLLYASPKHCGKLLVLSLRPLAWLPHALPAAYRTN